MNKFINTKQYKKFAEFCAACHRDRYIGVCYGAAGVGKTESALHYTNWDKIMKNAKTSNFSSQPLPTFSMSRFNSILYTPSTLALARDIIQDIKHTQRQFSLLKERALYLDEIPLHVHAKCHNYAELVIIDEAERLKPQAFELIRELYDKGGVTFIFIGMPGMEKIIGRYPQLYSRVGFVHQFKNLGKNEVEFIITKHFLKLGITIDADDFCDQETVSTIIRMTNGNFRLINRLLKQSHRIMMVNCMTSLSAEILEAARKCLLIGER
ncbi:MAG: AAA family ATPase [Tatlockia sp.]|nr:AAA family ATPase [Tatlockia sp.]